MSDATTLQRLREANPFPDPASLREVSPDQAVLLAIIEERTRIMSLKQTRPVAPSKEPESKRPVGWVVAATAFIAVIITMSLAILLTRDTAQQPVAPTDGTSSSEALETARAFIEARNKYDGDRLASLLSPDAEIVADVTQDPTEYHAVADFERVAGFEFQSVECIDTSLQDLTRAFCTFEFESDWSRALGMDPVSGNNVRVIVEDGKIRNLAVTLNFGVLADLQQRFQQWLEINHPEAVSMMFRPAEFAPTPILTPTSIALFERYTAEYVEEMTGG